MGPRLEVELQHPIGTTPMTATEVEGVQRDAAVVAGGDRTARTPSGTEARRFRSAPPMPAHAGYVTGGVAAQEHVPRPDHAEPLAIRKCVGPSENRTAPGAGRRG